MKPFYDPSYSVYVKFYTKMSVKDIVIYVKKERKNEYVSKLHLHAMTKWQSKDIISHMNE